MLSSKCKAKGMPLVTWVDTTNNYLLEPYWPSDLNRPPPGQISAYPTDRREGETLFPTTLKSFVGLRFHADLQKPEERKERGGGRKNGGGNTQD
eukprot:761112-Hanusia_phi.AAC.3